MGLAGYAFGHVEGYALKPSAKAKDGKRSAGDIIDELYRVDGAAPHVTRPTPPLVLEGPDTAAKMKRLLADEYAARKKALRANREGGRKGKRMREDQQLLEGSIYSLPVLSADYLAADRQDATNAQKLAKADADRAIELHRDWIHADARRRGLDVAAIVVHLDEKHVHLHAHSIPQNERMSVKSCHPGHTAAEQFRADWTAQNGDKLTKDALGKKDNAYTTAMREWQDRYWKECAGLCGLTRKGPGVERMNRMRWRGEKAKAALYAAAAKGMKNREDGIQQQREQVETKQQTLNHDRIALADDRNALRDDLRKLEGQKKTVAAAWQAFDAILSDQVVAHDIEGLELATEAEARRGWWEAAKRHLKPATAVWERLVSVARKVAAWDTLSEAIIAGITKGTIPVEKVKPGALVAALGIEREEAEFLVQRGSAKQKRSGREQQR